MITLNLISPAQKKELLLLRVFIVLKNAINVLMLSLIFIAMIILLSKLVMQNNFNRTIDEYNRNTRTGQLFGQEIKQFNHHLLIIKSIQDDFTTWSDFLINISNITPNDIVLYSLSVDKNAREVQISGRAKTRQALIDYQANLEAVKCFEEICIECTCFEGVEIPLSVLLEKENIDFKFLTKLNDQSK